MESLNPFYLEYKEQSADNLAQVSSDLQEELKITKRQRIRDLMKHPEQEELLAQTYDELESDLQKKIEGIGHQIDLFSDKRNTIIQVNRVAKTAMEVFRDILEKNRLERRDLELIIRQIKVYEDHLEIQLQADVDAILRSGTLPEEEEAVAAMACQGDTVNFKGGMEHISPVTIVQAAKNRPDKVFHANVINDGESSWIQWACRSFWGRTSLSGRNFGSTLSPPCQSRLGTHRRRDCLPQPEHNRRRRCALDRAGRIRHHLHRDKNPTRQHHYLQNPLIRLCLAFFILSLFLALKEADLHHTPLNILYTLFISDFPKVTQG